MIAPSMGMRSSSPVALLRTTSARRPSPPSGYSVMTQMEDPGTMSSAMSLWNAIVRYFPVYHSTMTLLASSAPARASTSSCTGCSGAGPSAPKSVMVRTTGTHPSSRGRTSMPTRRPVASMVNGVAAATSSKMNSPMSVRVNSMFIATLSKVHCHPFIQPPLESCVRACRGGVATCNCCFGKRFVLGGNPFTGHFPRQRGEAPIRDCSFDGGR